MSNATYHWIFLSLTTHKFLAINQYGKVCLESQCIAHCRFIIHGVSMPSSHLIIRLQNAVNKKYYLQIDGPSPFVIDGYGGNSKQSKKSIFRYTSKVKNGENVAMLESVRWGFYISCKSSGEIYINQYADTRSSFYRFRIPSITPYHAHNAFNILPQFVQNIIIQNEEEGVPNTHVPNTHNDDDDDDDDDDNKCNKYDTPSNKHTIFTSIISNKNLNILPMGHITAKGGKGAFARFIIKRISLHDDIIIIQNTQLSQYISINNIHEIITSKKYWDISSHWKIIIKSQTLNGQKIIILKSCLNNQLLAVNDKGMIKSVPFINDKGMKHTQFIMDNIEAKYFSFFQNFIDNVGQKMNVFNIKQPFKGRALTFEEKRFFYDFGFVVIKKAIPAEIYKAALQFINDAISRGEHLWSCRERIILDLYFQSHLYSIIQSLLGSSVESLVYRAQIDIYLTQQFGARGIEKKKELNDQIGTFSILVGIVLSQCNKEWMGNFTAFPNTHTVINQLLHQYGMEYFIKKQNDIETNINCKPKQIIACPGDIILCHPFLAHRIAPNYSNNIKYGVFMRPIRMDHKQNIDMMINKNMWIEYDGLNDVINYYQQKNNNIVKQPMMHKKAASVPYITVPPPINPYYLQQQQQQQQYNNNKKSNTHKYQKYSV